MPTWSLAHPYFILVRVCRPKRLSEESSKGSGPLYILFGNKWLAVNIFLQTDSMLFFMARCSVSVSRNPLFPRCWRGDQQILRSHTESLSFTTMIMNRTVPWYMTWCGHVEVNRYFGELTCHHFHGRINSHATNKKAASTDYSLSSSETSENFHRTTRRRIPKRLCSFCSDMFH
jgi:hypothetical protein